MGKFRKGNIPWSKQHSYLMKRGKNHPNYNINLHITEKTLCNCGCGNYVSHPKSRPKKFIWGHNTRLRTIEEKRKQIQKAHIALLRKLNAEGRKTPFYKLLKESVEYKQWRKKIFERDNYTCQECFIKGGRLHSHHIKPFSLILRKFLQNYSQFSIMEDKETLLRLAIFYKPFWKMDNGITYCRNCHKKTSNYGSKKFSLASLIAGR